MRRRGGRRVKELRHRYFVGVEGVAKEIYRQQERDLSSIVYKGLFVFGVLGFAICPVLMIVYHGLPETEPCYFKLTQLSLLPTNTSSDFATAYKDLQVDCRLNTLLERSRVTTAFNLASFSFTSNDTKVVLRYAHHTDPTAYNFYDGIPDEISGKSMPTILPQEGTIKIMHFVELASLCAIFLIFSVVASEPPALI